MLLTLLYLTPLLYHLPKPVLAAMIMLAVFNLIDVGALRRAWLASREDGIAGTATFVATLAFAPYIQNGILVGIFISLAAFLYGRMRPRVQRMAVAPGGTLVEAAATAVEGGRSIAALRFDASLYFANVSFFEDAVLALGRDNPALSFVLVDASAINYIDASGIEILARIAENLRQRGITLVLSGVKEQVLRVARRTGLVATLGADNVFASEQAAVDSVRSRAPDARA